MTIDKLLGSDEQRKAYEVWLNSPMTQNVISVMQEYANPVELPLEKVSAEYGLYLHGMNVGYAKFLSLLRDMVAIQTAARAAEKVGAIPSDYTSR